MAPFQLIVSYLLTTIVFFVIDLLWLGLIAKDLYDRILGNLLAEQVNWAAAIIFYLIFIIGIFVFAILPAVEKQSWQQALIMGALFGFFTYATYDLTNLAVLKGWPIQIVFIDVAWGVVLTSMVSVSGYYICNWVR